MNAVRVRRKLESETLHLPELKPLVGKNVEIIVLEEAAPREAALAEMAADPQMQRELTQIAREFAPADMDGLEQP